jgi:hypothetical protein
VFDRGDWRPAAKVDGLTIATAALEVHILARRERLKMDDLAAIWSSVTLSTPEAADSDTTS